METKAHHALIGTFVIVFMASLFGFLVWASKFEGSQNYKDYDVYFAESVLGLDKASSVLFNGIPVGQVTDISIPAQNPQLVLVTIKIKSDVPILEDTTATLAMEGITGVLAVQIKGGAAGSPPLKPGKGEKRAVIPAVPSPIEELFVGIPHLVQKAAETLNRINQVLGDENIQSFNDMLSNFKLTSETIAAEAGNIKDIIGSMKDILGDIEGIVEQDLAPAGSEIKVLTQKANQLLATVDKLVDENGDNITAFTASLPELGLLITELRQAVRSINALAESLDEDPSELIFPRTDPEYDVE